VAPQNRLINFLKSKRNIPVWIILISCGIIFLITSGLLWLNLNTAGQKAASDLTSKNISGQLQTCAEQLQTYKTNQSVSSLDPASSASPTTLNPPPDTYSLAFNNLTVIFKRSGPPFKTDQTALPVWSWWAPPFWGTSFQKADIVGPKDLDPYFQNLSLGRSLFSSQTNTFYLLQPGGYSTFRLIPASSLPRLLSTKAAQGTVKPSRATACKLSDFPLGQITAKAMSCHLTIQNPDDATQTLLTQTNVDCYLPVNPDLFLAYEQPLKPEGEIDLCTQLLKIGIQNVLSE